MLFAGFVVKQEFALQCGGKQFFIKRARAVGGGRGGAHQRFKRVVRGASIAIGKSGDAFEHAFAGVDFLVAVTAFLVRKRALQQTHDFSIRQRLQRVDARAREQRCDHLKRRILRSRADESDVPRFDMGKKSILLRLVESMHFVDEYDGASAGAPCVFGSGHHVFDLSNAAHYRAEGDKFGMRAPRNQARERGLAAAGRSPENHRTEVVGFDGRAQRLSRAEQRLLARKFFERARTHAFGERRAGRCDFGFHFGE